MAASNQLALRRYGAPGGSHAHEHFQALVGLHGTLEIEVEGRGRRIAPGAALLVPPGARHDFESSDGSRCLVLDSCDPAWAACLAVPRAPSQVAGLASYLAEALANGSALAGAVGPALLLEAWTPRIAATRPRRRLDWDALGAWTQLHLHLPLTVADLASRVHLGTSQFTLRCHEAQGLSPQAWLRQQRLQRARQLRALGVPVAEVARRTGYRSPSALTAALRRGP